MHVKTEHVFASFIKFMSDSRVIHQSSSSYTPHENRIVERKNDISKKLLDSCHFTWMSLSNVGWCSSYSQLLN